MLLLLFTLGLILKNNEFYSNVCITSGKFFTVDNKLMDRIDHLHQVNLLHKEKSLLSDNLL